MSQKKVNREESFTTVKKINQIKQQFRKAQMQGKFTCIRKKIIKARDQQQFQEHQIEQNQIISAKIKQLKQCHRDESYEIVNQLWNNCVNDKNYVYLNQDNMKYLIWHLMRLQAIKVDSKDQQLVNEYMMVIWIIESWASHANHFNINLQELVKLLVELMEINISPKINHLIIYTLLNLCRDNLVRIQLIQLDIIRKMLRCQIYKDKETDITTFLCNIIYQLPYTFDIGEDNLNILLSFIQICIQKIKNDQFMREDCMLIIQKILKINDFVFHQQTINKLTPMILYFIECLQNAKDMDITLVLFKILTNVYAKQYPKSAKLKLFSEQVIIEVWKLCQQFLNDCYDANAQNIEEEIQKQIWCLIQNICKIKQSEIVQSILDELYQKCNNQSIGDFQEKALKIVTQNISNRQMINFCIKHLPNHMSNEELTIALLQRLLQSLHSHKNPQKILKTSKSFEQLLQKIQCDSTESVQKLIHKIFLCDSQYRQKYGTSDLVQDQETVTGSFNTISQVLTSPQKKTSSTQPFQAQCFQMKEQSYSNSF